MEKPLQRSVAQSEDADVSSLVAQYGQKKLAGDTEGSLAILAELARGGNLNEVLSRQGHTADEAGLRKMIGDDAGSRGDAIVDAARSSHNWERGSQTEG